MRALLLVLLATPAAAEPPHTTALFSMQLGIGSGTSDPVVATYRAEAIGARVTADDNDNLVGWGLGMYGQALGGTPGRALYGTGGTLVRYNHGFALAPSFGVDRRGVEAGLFVGARGWTTMGMGHRVGFDLPAGVRFDSYVGDNERSVAVSFTCDPTIIVGGIAAAIVVISALGHQH
jgi:hypothetical protein